MSQVDNETLNREFGKFMSEFGVRTSGQLGASFAAKFLPNNTSQLSIDVTTDPTSALNAVTDILTTEGKLLDTQHTPEIFESKSDNRIWLLEYEPCPCHCTNTPDTFQANTYCHLRCSKGRLD